MSERQRDTCKVTQFLVIHLKPEAKLSHSPSLCIPWASSLQGNTKIIMLKITGEELHQLLGSEVVLTECGLGGCTAYTSCSVRRQAFSPQEESGPHRAALGAESWQA